MRLSETQNFAFRINEQQTFRYCRRFTKGIANSEANGTFSRTFVRSVVIDFPRSTRRSGLEMLISGSV